MHLKHLSVELGFQYFPRGTHHGLNANIEFALGKSKGEFVSILASDDWIVPDKIAEQIAILGESGEDAIYGTSFLLFDDGRNEPVDLGNVEKAFANGTALDLFYVDGSHAPLLQSALIRRKPFLDLIAERARFKSDDWVMLIRLVERHKVAFRNRPWFHYRQHGANTYRSYWKTLPMRAEILSEVTPEELRPLGFSNMFYDQAMFLYMDGKKGLALRFLLASVALRPSTALRTMGNLGWRTLRQAARKRRR